jgi:hypothetical protein
MAISNDQLVEQIQKLNDLVATFGDRMGAWANGVAGGGPNGNGTYPLPISLGATIAVKCPAQLAADSQKIVMANNGGITLGITPGYTAEGNSNYTFKASDSGKVFSLLSANNAANNTISLWLPDNLPAGWTVIVIQIGNSPLRFRKVGDTTSVSATLRNRQTFFTTAGLGSMGVAFCETVNSQGLNAIFSIAGDLKA